MNKFWKFKTIRNQKDPDEQDPEKIDPEQQEPEKDEDEEIENILILNGAIADESWWGDEVTPAAFKTELESYSGDLTVWINSPGGDVFAASEIYNALKEHKGKITVKIDSLAASAASVIAMAGDMVYMSPVSMLMCHNPSMMLYGEVSELEQGIEFLNQVKESIINAYQAKTGLSHAKISKMMDSETWLNAKAALELGFCDKILYTEDSKEVIEDFMYDKTSMVTNTVAAMKRRLKAIEKEPQGTDISQLETRLNLLK